MQIQAGGLAAGAGTSGAPGTSSTPSGWAKLLGTAALLAALTACGGGGGGGSGSGSTGTGGSAENPAGNPGSNSPGNGAPGNPDAQPTDDSPDKPDDPPPSTAVSLAINSQALVFNTFLSSVYDAQVVQVGGTFQGDGVLVGFAPGVAAPDWLTVAQSSVVEHDGQFTLDMSILPQQQAVGTYSTSVRFVSGRESTGELKYVDLPVQLQVFAPPPLYSGTVAFSASTTDTTLPAHRIVPLDFGAYKNPTFTVSLQDDNSIASTWLTATKSGNGIDVAIAAAKPIGHYKAKLRVDFQAGGATGATTIPVEFDVGAGAPQIDYVVPSVVYDTGPADVIVRGAGFDLSTVQGVSLDGQAALSFQVRSATEIAVKLAQPLATGAKQLQVTMADAALSRSYSMTVKAHPQTALTSLDLGEECRHVRYDTARDAIVAVCTNTVYRLQFVAGAWQVVTQRALPVGSFDLSPDFRYIVYASGGRVRLLDAATLADVTSYPLPNAATELPDGAYSYGVGDVLNNGDVVMVQYQYNNTDLYLYNLNSQIFTNVQRHNYNPYFYRSTLRDRSYIGSATDAYDGQDFNGYYSASSGTFVSVAAMSPLVYHDDSAISGDGSRVMMSSSIYDTNMTLLGVLQDNTLYNVTQQISADGRTGYLIDGGNGLIRRFDVSGAPPYPALGDINFPAYSYYVPSPSSLVTPDGSMLILYGGWLNGGTQETHLKVIPLP